jgi:RNA-binding protein 39
MTKKRRDRERTNEKTEK